MFEIIKNNKHISYYLNNKLHREDGSADIWDGGYISYYLNGKHHRTNGPAVIWGNGYAGYYLNGIRVTRDKLNV